MNLETVIIADNATVAEGKLYVHGGGITRVTPPHLPWTHPLLTFVLRMQADDVDDYLHEHEIAFALVDPEGNAVVPRGIVTVSHEQPPFLVEGEPLFASLALSVAPLLFRIEGLHTVEIDLDGERVADVPLPVRVLTRAP